MSTRPSAPAKPEKTVTRKTGTMSDGYTSLYWFLFDNELDKPCYVDGNNVESLPIAHLIAAGDRVQVEFDDKGSRSNARRIAKIKLVKLAG